MVKKKYSSNSNSDGSCIYNFEMVKYEDHYEALSDVFESTLCISITHENMYIIYIQMAIPVDLHGWDPKNKANPKSSKSLGYD